MTRGPTFKGAAAALAVVVLIAIGAAAYLRDQRNPIAVASPAPVVSATSAAASPTAATPRSTLSLAPGTAVYCGTVAANTIPSGQGSGSRTFEFLASSPSGSGRFSVPESLPLPTIGSYLCGQFEQGAPTSALKVVLQPGDSGYVANTWASACGTVSDFVAITSTTNGSLVLNSTGRPPLKITLTSAKLTPGGAIAGYICTSLETGVPNPIFAGLWPPNTAGFVAEGSLPATKVDPAPAGFVVPQLCAYVQPPLAGGDQTEWKVDCGATANRDARGTLAPSLTQQGWTSCAVGLGGASWAKGTVRLFVGESPGSPGEYPKIVQPVRPAASPSCP